MPGWKYRKNNLVTIDRSFFPKPNPLSIADILEFGHSSVYRGSVDFIVQNVGQIKKASPNILVFALNKNIITSLENSVGYALICTSELAEQFGNNILSNAEVILISNNPKYAFAQICSFLYSNEKEKIGIVHPTAQIDKSATIAEDVSIGPFCNIADGVNIGSGSRLGVGVSCNSSVRIGKNCQISDYVTIEKAVIDDDVSIGQHTVIGKSGFGFATNEDDVLKIPHLGRVLVGSETTIGAHCCIDRGTLQDTRIADLVMIDNLVHISHNVQIGRKSIILAQVGIAGSSVVKENCIIGGQTGLADHIEIAPNTVILSHSGVTKTINASGVYAGFPAKKSKVFWSEQAKLSQLTKNSKKNHGVDK